MAVETGTVHIFAVSGLHLGICVGLIVFVLNACGVPRTHWILFLAPLLVGYTLMIGARPSAVRACIMALVYFGAAGLGRRADIPSAVALAASAIIVWEPGQLFDVGFLFSFVVVIGLLVFCPILWHWFSPWAQRDVLKADLLVGTQDRVWLSLRKYLLGLLTVSIAAGLVSTPLTAHFFGRITPVALLGNLLVVPLTFLLVLCGSISIVCGGALPLIAEIYNFASLGLSKMLVGILRLMSWIPHSSYEVRPWPLWAVLLSYAMLGCVALGLYARRVHSDDADGA